MKAVVLEKSCKPEEMKIKEIPVPEVKTGWVLVKVKAFGLNYSEILLRRYEIMNLINKYNIKPHIGAVYEFKDISKAHKDMEEHKNTGKNVVIVNR